MTTGDNANFPQIGYPFVDDRGNISQPWLQVMIALYNRTGGSQGNISTVLDTISNVEGAVLFRGARRWSGLVPGTSGYVLETLGENSDPVWAQRVKQVDTGIGLTGGPIMDSGTVGMAQMPSQTLKGNADAETADPADLTPADVKGFLNYIESGDDAGADLGGTYPNPSVEKVQGTSPSTLGLALLAEPSAAQAQSDLSLVPGMDVFKQRTITGTSGQISVSDGDGVSGNPTLALDPAIIGAWTEYTPTVSASSGTFTSVSATGRYKQIGKTVFFAVSVTITTAGTAAGTLKASLPSAPTALFAFSGIDGATKALSAFASTTTGADAWVNYYDTTTVIADGRSVFVSGSYEAT